jgi:hypothetical protein
MPGIDWVVLCLGIVEFLSFLEFMDGYELLGLKGFWDV